MKKFDSSYNNFFFSMEHRGKFGLKKGGLKSTASGHPSVWKSPPRDFHMLRIPCLGIFEIGMWSLVASNFQSNHGSASHLPMPLLKRGGGGSIHVN